jgi:MauM/NapG family ferredoxin protein
VAYRLGANKGFKKIDLSRRRFIQSGIAGVVTVGAISTGLVNRIAKGKAIRPPGALEEEAFLDRCVRCQECVRICSTTGACLQPAFLESGLQGIWTPISVPREGYCEFNCILCSEVCPSGAIYKLDLEIKQKTKMGLAYFDKSRCIPWYKHIDCLVCEEHCPLPEKAIKFDSKEVVRPDGSRAVVKYPYVDETLCIGCGICVTKCPVIGEAGIFVTNAEEQRWSERS